MSEPRPELTFHDPSKTFALGFEAGRVWQDLQLVENEFVVTVHGANAEMLLRMSEATGRALQTIDLNETWMEARFAPLE